jgi:hypothetical protein
MSFINKFVQGEIDFGTEEKREVMNKTVSVSTDPTEEKIKVDHLDSDNSMEKDILKQRKAERDVTGTVALPLFRFEEKQKKEIIEKIKEIVEFAAKEIKDNIGGPYTPLFRYVDVLKSSEVDYKVNLVVSRNKELFNTSEKDFEIEIVTCYVDKKLRVRFDIPEDKPIDEKIEVDYASAKKSIYKAFAKLYQSIIDTVQIKNSGTEKDMEVKLIESAGDEDHGTGYSIVFRYNKLIDYSNYRRGKEDYGMYGFALDDDFKKSLEDEKNSHNIEEQISISPSRSAEAIADGMTEDSSDENSENQEGTDNESIADDQNDEDFGNDDFEGGEDDGMGGDEEGDDSMGDDSSEDSTDSSPEPEKPKIAGKNPFAEVNSKDKLSIELRELKDQIDKVLKKLGQFKSNVVVKKLIELDSIVEDALKNAYTVPIQDSMIRYSMYVVQFEDLISELAKYFESGKSAQ